MPNTVVFLTHQLFRTALSLKRTPKYLRFACKGLASCSRNWDALDQLDDEPEAGEQLIAARLKDRGTMHLDRVVKGRRVGEWHDTATYEPVEPQPGQEVMRDREQWRAWCEQQEASQPCPS